MKLGIISDSHDNLPKIEKAVQIFNREKVELVLHAGDYVAPFSLVPLEKLNCEYLGVFGNNDGEKEGLSKKSGGRIKEGPIILSYRNSKGNYLEIDLPSAEIPTAPCPPGQEAGPDRQIPIRPSLFFRKGCPKEDSARDVSRVPIWDKESKKILLIHDIQKSNGKLNKFDLLIFGHSHKSQIKKENNILYVNPGECGGWLSGESTVAVIDLSLMSAKIINL